MNDKIRSILTMPILDTPLSSRSKNVIIRHVWRETYFFVDAKYQLIMVNDAFRLFANNIKEDIMMVRGMGEKTYEEIDEYLNSIGLTQRRTNYYG